MTSHSNFNSRQFKKSSPETDGVFAGFGDGLATPALHTHEVCTGRASCGPQRAPSKRYSGGVYRCLRSRSTTGWLRTSILLEVRNSRLCTRTCVVRACVAICMRRCRYVRARPLTVSGTGIDLLITRWRLLDSKCLPPVACGGKVCHPH